MEPSLFEVRRDELVAYLEEEKYLYQKDIEEAEGLSDEEKVEKGLLILHARFTEADKCHYAFSCEENNTKLRAGDAVYLISESSKRRFSAIVVENELEGIILSLEGDFRLEGFYRIEVSQMVMLDPLIELTRRMEEGSIGAAFFKMLFKEKEPSPNGLGAIPAERIKLPSYMNDNQRNAIMQAVKRPSLYTIQGPPGTGKTDVLATIAIQFSQAGKEVLIVSNTHFAVNNALAKIHAKADHLPVSKIGELLKANDLDEGINRYATFQLYAKKRKEKVRRRSDPGAVVGMTIQSAIINLGLRSSGFSPMVVLVDEAGQVSLTQGAILGTFGAGSMLFIGDDRQMPPLYHPHLVGHPLSTSIFTHLKTRFPALSIRLTETFRMNRTITELVSKAFYEDSGEALVPSAYSADRLFKLPSVGVTEDMRLTEKESVILCEVNSDQNATDANRDEATEAVSLIKSAMRGGLLPNQVAVITPFRRQVKLIKTLLKEIPEAAGVIVDTVERLQGKDVEMIIISLCASSAEYIGSMTPFILNKNRLNVMISRAKSKVIIFHSKHLKDPLYKTLLLEYNH